MPTKKKNKNPKIKEKAMVKTNIAETVTTNEIKKAVNVAISPYRETLGANFDTGHISKMSSYVKVNEMFVDYTYQRSPLKAKINRIVKNFNPDLLGVITCSMREDNTLAIIDGSHRYHALIQMGMENSSINALVYFGLSIEDEAHIFALTNKEHTKPTPSQIFKAGIVSGDKTCVGIANVVAKVGASFDEGPGANVIRCIATIRRVYTNAGPSVLAKTLETLKAAYPDNKEMYRDQMISAIGCIYHRYGKKVDQKRLSETLARIGNPSLVIAQAQAMMSSGQIITFTSLPFLIVSRYNVKLKNNRLPDFPMNLLPQQVWAKS